MRSCRLLVGAICLLITCGCQTITSDHVVFEPERLGLPLDRLEGSWIDSEGETFTVRREAHDRLIIESDAEGEKPLTIAVLPEGGFRIDQPPEEGEPQPPVFVDFKKIDEGYLLVAAERHLRGRDLSWLMHVRTKFNEESPEIELVSLLNGEALFELLERQPRLLLHEKSWEQRENGFRKVTIRLKDDPAKIRQFILDHVKDEKLFSRAEPALFRKTGNRPGTRPTTRGT